MRLAAFLVLLVASAGCLDAGPTPPEPPEAPAAPAPNAPEAPGSPEPTAAPTPKKSGPSWGFTDTKGVQHSRDSPDGNATVLFFMASWCSTCRSKTPMLADANAAYEGKGVRWYSISWDSTDDAKSLDAWSERYANKWPHGVDPMFTIQKAFGVTSQSTVVVLDGEGKLVKRFDYGRVTPEGLRATIDDALAARPATA